MSELDTIGTWYVPEGESITVEFPTLREGNDPAAVLVCDDRGTLIAPAYIQEADTDDLLFLKQFNAARIIESIRAAVKYGDKDPAGPWEIDRREDGTYDVESKSVNTAEEAM